MAGFTNYAYRAIVRRFGGVGLLATEMLSARGLREMNARHKGTPERLWGVRDEPRPLAVQIWDNDPATLAEAAARLVEDYHPSVIDINFGCPARDVSEKAQSGAYLLGDPDRVGAIVARVVAACGSTPVTAKIRLGPSDETITAVDVVQAIEGAGGAAVTVHGRTARQMFRGQADWDRIAALKPHLTRIPLVGNGDLKTPEAVREAFARYGVDGVMIGRAGAGASVAVSQVGGRAGRRADPARAEPGRTARRALGPLPADRRAFRRAQGHDPHACLRLLLRPGHPRREKVPRPGVPRRKRRGVHRGGGGVFSAVTGGRVRLVSTRTGQRAGRTARSSAREGHIAHNWLPAKKTVGRPWGLPTRQAIRSASGVRRLRIVSRLFSRKLVHGGRGGRVGHPAHLLSEFASLCVQSHPFRRKHEWTSSSSGTKGPVPSSERRKSPPSDRRSRPFRWVQDASRRRTDHATTTGRPDVRPREAGQSSTCDQTGSVAREHRRVKAFGVIARRHGNQFRCFAEKPSSSFRKNVRGSPG